MSIKALNFEHVDNKRMLIVNNIKSFLNTACNTLLLLIADRTRQCLLIMPLKQSKKQFVLATETSLS
jgi:hypothetical protein